MPTVADCLRQHGETFLQQLQKNSDKISLQQWKVLSAITHCRTGELGHVIFACDGCGRQHWVGRSCGNRILECTDESVTFQYTPSGTKTVKTRKVSGVKFVRGFLQHALPKGFSKVRYYGWMASNSRTTRDRVKWLVWLYLGWTYWLGSGVAPQPDRHQSRIRCKDCGGELRVIGMTNAEGRIICRVLPDHATKFLDSG